MIHIFGDIELVIPRSRLVQAIARSLCWFGVYLGVFRMVGECFPFSTKQIRVLSRNLVVLEDRKLEQPGRELAIFKFLTEFAQICGTFPIFKYVK